MKNTATGKTGFLLGLFQYFAAVLGWHPTKIAKVENLHKTKREKDDNDEDDFDDEILHTCHA